MTDQAASLTEFEAAEKRDQLGDAYRAAYREARLDHDSRSPRLALARRDILDNVHVFNRPDTAENFIEGIKRDVEHDLIIESARRHLADQLDATHKQIAELARALATMQSNDVYDIEIAEGDTTTMQAALTGLRLNLAALRGLTRHAAPEDRP